MSYKYAKSPQVVRR